MPPKVCAWAAELTATILLLYSKHRCESHLVSKDGAISNLMHGHTYNKFPGGSMRGITHMLREDI